MAVATKERTPEEKRKRKQERAKARRKVARRDAAISELYKPLDQWDEEELAKGRPKDINGRFSGPAPKWVSSALHEEAIRRFTDLAQADLRGLVPRALKTIEELILNDKVDEKGRPVIPPAVRLQASQFVVEHLVGKPKQRLEADISVKLQGILANVMVAPGEGTPALTVGDDEDIEDADLVED